MEREHVVAAIVDAAGGKLTGRVRLQKVIYLLDQLGLGSNFEYEYHHYGPYSADLASATEDAKAFKLINEKFEYRESDGARYSVFETVESANQDEGFGRLDKELIRALLAKFQQQNATILELAATIDWLWRHEKIDDWKSELIQRKGIKTEEGRLEKAVKLLDELDLSPPKYE